MDTEGNWCLIYREHCWLWAPGRLFLPLLHPPPNPGWPWEAVIELWLSRSACHGLGSPVAISCFSFISSVSSCGMGGSSNCAVDWLRLVGVMLVVCSWLSTFCTCSWDLSMVTKSSNAFLKDALGCQRWLKTGSVAMSASLHLSYLDQEVRIQTSYWRSRYCEEGDASDWVPCHLLLFSWERLSRFLPPLCSQTRKQEANSPAAAAPPAKSAGGEAGSSQGARSPGKGEPQVLGFLYWDKAVLLLYWGGMPSTCLVHTCTNSHSSSC